MTLDQTVAAQESLSRQPRWRAEVEPPVLLAVRMGYPNPGCPSTRRLTPLACIRSFRCVLSPLLRTYYGFWPGFGICAQICSALSVYRPVLIRVLSAQIEAIPK